jgi:hypothetical protein
VEILLSSCTPTRDPHNQIEMTDYKSPRGEVKKHDTNESTKFLLQDIAVQIGVYS